MPPTESQSARPPVYVGPRPFRTGEPLFGRDREVSALANLLIAERVVVLHSPSGAGKSSLIHAGLVPRLRPRPDPPGATAVWSDAFDVPAVGQATGADAAAVVVRLNVTADLPSANRYVLSGLLSLETHRREDARRTAAELAGYTLAGYLDEAFPIPRPDDAHGDTPYQPLVLLFDQFEECLTLDPTDTAAKREFFRQLADVLANRWRWVLIAVRGDYLADLDPYRAGLPGTLSARYRLDRLGPEAAERAIVGPAKEAGIAFEAAADVVRELRRLPPQPGDEPRPAGADEPLLPFVEPVYLQVVCRGLEQMDRADPWAVTAADVKRLAKDGLPGVERELARYYEASVRDAAAATGVPERRIRAWVDKALLTVDGKRGRAREKDAGRFGVTPAAVRELERVYLVRSTADGAERWLELAHDRLAGPVRWENNRVLTAFQRAAATWHDTPGRPPDMLVSGDLLARGEEEEKAGGLDPAEQEFLAASRARVADQRSRFRGRLVAFGLGGLVGLTAVALVAYSNQLSIRDLEVRQNLDLARRQELSRVSQVFEQQKKQLGRAVDAEKIDDWAWRPGPDGRDVPPSAVDKVAAALGLIDRTRRYGVQSPDAETVVRSSVRRLGWEGLFNFGEWVPVHNGENVWVPLPARAVAFSPDGRWLAAAGGNELIVWDLRTRDGQGGTPRQAWRPPGISATALTFAPDGRGLYIGQANGSVSRVEPRGDGQPWSIEIQLAGPGVNIRSIQLGAVRDGQPSRAGWVVCVAADGRVMLFREKGQAFEFPRPSGDGPPDRVTGVDLTPDPKVLYAGTTDGHVFTWDLLSDNPTAQRTGVRTDVAVVALAAHPSDPFLAAVPYRGGIAFWPAAPADRIATNAVTIDAGTDRLAFHPSGNWLAGQAVDRSLWLAKRFDDPPPGAYALADGFSPGTLGPVSAWVFDRSAAGRPRSLLLVGTQEGRAWVYDLGANGVAPFALSGPRSEVTAVALSGDQTWAAAGCRDGTVHLWNLRHLMAPADGEPWVLRGLTTDASGLAVSPDGKRVAAYDSRGSLCLWSLLSPATPPRKLQLTMSPGMHLLLDDRHLTAYRPFIFGDDIAIQWDVSGLEPKPIAPPEWKLAELGLTPTDPSLVTSDRKWIIWLHSEVKKPVELVVRRPGDEQGVRHPVPMARVPKRFGEIPQLPGPPAETQGAALLAAGGRLLAGVADGRLLVWPFDPSTGVPGSAAAADAYQTDRFECLAVSPTGRHVAAGTADGRVWVWGVVGGPRVPLVAALRGHRGPVRSVAFTPDGRRVVAGGADGTVRIWDLTDPALDPVVLTGHAGDVTALAFAPRPDGLRLVTAGADGTVRVWTLDPRALVARVRDVLRPFAAK